MKKILALLVSLVLMCSSIGAVAEENYTTTLRFDLAMEELLMLSGAEFSEEEEAIADILLPLIEKLNFKLITADEQMQLSLAIDDAAIASLTGGISGDQIVIVSDLFPSCYLSLSLETLESLMVEAAAVMPQIDANAEAAMEKAIDAAVNNLIDALNGHIGQVENGTFVVDGETFTEKLPLNISLEELVLLFMNLFKDLAADPTMATMLAMMDADTAMMDDMIADLQQAAATDPHPCDLVLYHRLGDEMALTWAVAESDQLIALSMLFLKDSFSGYVAVGDINNASYTAMHEAASSGMEDETFVIEWEGKQSAEGVYECTFTLINAGLSLNCAANLRVTEKGCYFDFSAGLLPIIAELIQVSVSVEEGGKITLPLTTEGKTALSLDTLMNHPEMEDQLLQTLLMDIENNGVNNLISNLIIALPEDAGTLMTQMMMLMPQGEPEVLEETTVTEIPAEAEAPASGGFMNVVRPIQEPAPTQAPASSGGGFMNVVRPTQEPAPTETPAPTKAPANPGFFGKPGN